MDEGIRASAEAGMLIAARLRRLKGHARIAGGRVCRLGWTVPFAARAKWPSEPEDCPATSRRADQVSAFTASNAQLSSLSHNIHALTRCLTLGNGLQALVCRDMLDSLDGDVRHHLTEAPGVLASLRPRARSAETRHRFNR